MDNRASSARVGYARLIDRFALPALPLPTIAVIDGAVRGRGQIRLGDQDILRFQPTYRPDDTPLADLRFALRYEGINLQVLSLLFTQRGAQDIQPLLEASRSPFSHAGSVSLRVAYRRTFVIRDTVAIVIRVAARSRPAVRPLERHA